jgi:hypothetical protein
MLKNLFSFLLIFFLAGDLAARAQTSSDSVIELITANDSLELPRQASVPIETLREVSERQIRKISKRSRLCICE